MATWTSRPFSRSATGRSPIIFPKLSSLDRGCLIPEHLLPLINYSALRVGAFECNIFLLPRSSPRAGSREHVARGREPIRRNVSSGTTSSNHGKTNPSSQLAYATSQADFDIDSITREVVRMGNIDAEPAEAGNDETRRAPD
jgi:hypothetical protein